ncbi:MAG: DNA repair protein RecO [Eubacteriales bacterium]|nr:DNA repair protein RecO [Eubacteriales bacterium]
MSDLITVQGVVLSAMPAGEYDKRIVILTRERGKLSVFAKGARRQNSPLIAAANPFVFGEFTLFEGRSSYSLNQVSITHHFGDLARLQPEVYYGFYFLELADYFGREGTDEKEMMNLLYVSIRALMNPQIPNRLIRCVFELRTMTEQGMMPQVFSCLCCGKSLEGEETFFSQEGHGVLCRECGEQAEDRRSLSGAALYAMQYITSAPMGRLYTFTLKEEVLWELERHVHAYMDQNTDKRFKSLQILKLMEP